MKVWRQETRARALPPSPIGVSFAGKADEHGRFKNKRAEMYFAACDWIRAGGALHSGRPGRRNGAELWRQLKQLGFRGCLRVVAEWAARRRQAERADIGAISRAPSARTIARLMTIGRGGLSKSETAVVARSSSARRRSYKREKSSRLSKP